MAIELKDRVYKLTRSSTPLSFMLPTRHTNRSPLLYFDKEKGYNRPLRYARNQKSPFEDEQDGNAIIEPIIFEDGMLVVPENNPVLQQFLHYHPLNGKKFMEVDTEKDAQKEVEEMMTELEAQSMVKDMSVKDLEEIGRVVLNGDVSTMDTYTLRRDVLVFAKKNPKTFMNAITDPDLQLLSTVQAFFDNRLLSLRNNNREVYFNLNDNKKRMAIIPFGEDPKRYLAEWFKTDDGIPVLEFLEKQM